MNCLFCNIVKGDIPDYRVAENDEALAFLDVNPTAKGHTIVISKFHAETLLDLPDDKLQGLFKLVKDTTALLKEKLSPDGFNIGANMHEAGGQKVEHLHIHVIPRWFGDGGGSMHTIVNKPPSESLDEVLKLLM